MSKFAEKMVCDDGAGGGCFRDVLSVLDAVSSHQSVDGSMADLLMTAADEIRRLRRKCNRLKARASAGEKSAAAAMLIAKTTIRCSIEHERDLRKELENGRR